MQKVSFATQNQLMASTCSCFVVLPWPHAPPRRRLHSIVQCRCLSQTDDPCGCRCYSRIRSQSRQPIPTTWQHSLTRTADSTQSVMSDRRAWHGMAWHRQGIGHPSSPIYYVWAHPRQSIPPYRIASKQCP
ncbi:hypothetical protein CABS02_08850 [Colletotrichum abscissum]|uniref:Uncharacterized protein n=1 Tax=Colletotrichum abscissum TaxID=1671311 RepID=A0A9P9XAZ7_9PEZI|nr:hypothetical protein CABS02_08850 [Colletotrichum abscissum]